MWSFSYRALIAKDAKMFVSEFITCITDNFIDSCFRFALMNIYLYFFNFFFKQESGTEVSLPRSSLFSGGEEEAIAVGLLVLQCFEPEVIGVGNIVDGHTCPRLFLVLLAHVRPRDKRRSMPPRFAEPRMQGRHFPRRGIFSGLLFFLRMYEPTYPPAGKGAAGRKG